MSEAIADVLKIALGLVTNKLRSYGAEKLQDGGLTDEQFRDWIVRELDDVKFKLDALSRRHLSASIGLFTQGVERLLMCFVESFSVFSQVEDTVGEAAVIVNVIGKLKIESKERFELAKGLFTTSAEEATLTFHNDALKTNERIHAAKVCIASAILGNLDDLENAVSDCLHFLAKLHKMPAIRVHIEGGLKSLFRKESREEIVETVTIINFILADFIMKFTTRRMGLFDWPMIECGNRAVHLIQSRKFIGKVKEKMKISLPWEITFPIPSNESPYFLSSFAINSKGDIYCIEFIQNLQTFDTAAGEWKPFCITSSNDEGRRCVALTIDDDDMMYVLSSSGTLSVYSPNGKIVHQRHLNDPRDGFGKLELQMIVTKDKKIIIFSYGDLQHEAITVYILDSCKGNQVKRFPICHDFKRGMKITFLPFEDEVTVAALAQSTFYRKEFRLYTYSLEGEFKGTIKLSLSDDPFFAGCITFDHVTNNYIVYFDTPSKTFVEWFSKNGKRLTSFFMNERREYQPNDCHLISHPNGAMAAVDITNGKVLYLRLPKMSSNQETPSTMI